MNTLLKTLFWTAATAAAWRIVRSFNAASVNSGDADEAEDARNRYRRAIHRWENEGGKALNRRRAGNEKRERPGPAERRTFDIS